MENKSNGIIRIAKMMVSAGIFIVLFFIYSGIAGVKDDMATLRVSQDTIKKEIITIKKENRASNTSDSIFQITILPIIIKNSEYISKNIK